MGARQVVVVVIVSAVGLAACAGPAGPTGSSAASASAESTTPPAGSATPPPATAAVVTAAPSAVASGCTVTTSSAGGVAVLIDDFAFNPATIEAKVGQPIIFTNNDLVHHGATLRAGDCKTGTFGKGASRNLVFSQVGTYAFYCPIHPDMEGTIEISG